MLMASEICCSSGVRGAPHLLLRFLFMGVASCGSFFDSCLTGLDETTPHLLLSFGLVALPIVLAPNIELCSLSIRRNLHYGDINSTE